MDKFLLPSKINYEEIEKNKANIVIEPLYFGYGTTMGNVLRRILLSSLPGAAVTAVKINGVAQEFSAIPNVKEDALEICLNLKGLRLKVFSDEPVKLTLRAKGETKVTAADFEKNSSVEIANPDLYIATITEKTGVLEMEVTVEKGRGYWPTEERKKQDLDIGTIMVDALFSPVSNVGYQVDNTRVEDITNYDKLTLDIETDGTISPKEAIEQAAKILKDHLDLLTFDKVEEVKEVKEAKEEEK